MAATVASISLVSCSTSTSSSSSSSSSSCSLKLHCFRNPCPSINVRISFSAPTISLYPSLSLNKKTGFPLYSAVEEIAVEETHESGTKVEEVAVEENPGSEAKEETRRKLYVVNLPWSFPVPSIKSLFGECGTVKDVEIIKTKDGRNKGFAFVTMGSGEEARAAIEKFDSYEISGRIIRVDFAKSMKKPSPPPPVGVPAGDTRYKLYVSNLAWKVRSSHLREFFGTVSNPVSTRVVFGNPSGSSTGYGFVSFATKEEADSALSALEGKELMGRPVRLKFSVRNVNESESKPAEGSAEGQPEESSNDVANAEGQPQVANAENQAGEGNSDVVNP